MGLDFIKKWITDKPFLCVGEQNTKQLGDLFHYILVFISSPIITEAIDSPKQENTLLCPVLMQANVSTALCGL